MTSDIIPAGRVALAVEYDGSAYHGWQIQRKPAVATVQGELERALGKIANHPVSTVCAGRTDAGVHASAQVVHFETSADRHPRAWVQGVNAHLPDDIAVRWATAVEPDFHARFSADRRTYRYIVLNRPVRSPILAGKVTHVRQPLSTELMQQAADYLPGERDFSAFRGAACQSSSPWRFVDYIHIRRQGDLVVSEICANAFLLHMVRNIMGVLLAVGRGEKPPSWADEVLQSCDRTCAGVTAKPDGLYLVQVRYPDHQLPSLTLGPAFLC